MSDSISLDGIIDEVIEIARRAGAAIMPFYGSDVAVERKADDSPVTAADHAANDVIVPALAGLTPDIPVVSEESPALERAPDISGGRFWLVDPLDGTKEFIAGRDEFTVNIALVVAGKPVLGVVGISAMGELFAAAGPGHVVHHAASGDVRHIAARTPPEDGLVAMISRSHADMDVIAALFADMKIKQRMIAGSSLKFCRIATGIADLYPRLGRTMEWDTAAGHAVLAAAGGSVRTLDAADLVYGKPGFENPHFLARGRDA